MADQVNYVKFLKGTYAGYKALANKDANSIYITTDANDRGIYVGGTRLGNYITVANIDALPAAATVSKEVLFYVEDRNVLARSNGANWVQINAAGLTKIVCLDEGGSPLGNVLASIGTQVDAETGAKVLTYTTASVATSEGLSDLQSRVGVAEGKLTTIQGEGEGSIKKAVADAKSELMGGAAEGTTLASVSTAAANAQQKADDAYANAATNAGDISSLKTQVGEGTVDSRIAALKTELQGKIDDVDALADQGIADAKAASDAAAAAQEKADDAWEKAGTNANDISGLKTQVGEGTVDSRIAAAKTALLGGATEGTDTIASVKATAAQGVANAATAQAAAEAAQDKADDAWEKAGTNASDISGLKTLTGTHTEQIAALQTAVGEGGSVDEKIDALRKEILTDGTADDTILDAYDTIQEIATWLSGSEGEDGKTAAEIITELNTHNEDIAVLKTQVGEGQVEGRITSAVNAAKTELQGKIDAVDALADKGIADAATAQTRADNAYELADSANTQANTNKESINTLNGLVGSTSVDSRIAAAKSALLGTATEGTDTIGTVKAAANAAQTRADNAYALAETANGTANTANSTANTNAGDISDLKTQVGEGTVDSRIATTKSEVLGTNQDAAGTATVHGALASAAAASTAAGNAQTKANSAYDLADTANTQANTNKEDIADLNTENGKLWEQLTWGTF